MHPEQSNMENRFGSGRFWPGAITAVGGCLSLLLLGEATAVVIGSSRLPEAFGIGALSSLIAIGTMIYGGYWIRSSDLAGERYRRIAGWCFGSGVAFLVLNLLIMVATPQEPLLLVIGWARWALSLGAGVGLLIGIFEARAIERARAAERLRAKQQAMEQQNELLEEFAGIVSHDLRNPLTVARGHLELAQDDVESSHLETVDSALERIDTITEETLLLARDGQAVGEPEPVDLDTLIDGCWRTVETQNAEVVTERLPTIEADPDRLRHIFENLFRNAVEHGETDVTVRVGSLDTDSGFFIEDNGAGIPPGEADNIFEPGYTTTDQGSGFGLGIVDRIVQAHGWQIRVTTSDDGGARFEITGVAGAERAARA